MNRCDCLDRCGDDPDVMRGKARKCPNFDRIRREEERCRAMEMLARELESPFAQETINNGLAYIIREYPDRAALARRLAILVAGHRV